MTENSGTFLSEVKNLASLTETENGAVARRVTALPDLARWMYMISDNREKVAKAHRKGANLPAQRYSVHDTKLSTDIVNHTNMANLEEVLRFLCFIRDPRLGLGERSLFRTVLSGLINSGKISVQNTHKFVETVVHHGRWDDILALIASVSPRHESIRIALIDRICEQLSNDVGALFEGRDTEVSLLAKWMPSVNTSSKASVQMARMFARRLNVSEKEYRKAIGLLRKHLHVVERNISIGDYSTIDYSGVPSLAMQKYRGLFLSRDDVRYSDYLEKVSEGKAKIHASVANPVELIADYRESVKEGNCAEGCDHTLEQMWRNLPSVNVSGNVLPVLDMSGSMYCRITSKIMSLDVAYGMGVYLSEHNTGPYKNLVCLFGDNCEILDLSPHTTLYGKLHEILNNSDGAVSTNVESVLKKVLEIAVKTNCAVDEIPTLVFISDTEFNGVLERPNKLKTLFEQYAEIYENHGYALPKIVFWNTAARTESVPMTQNKNGLVLLSGFSQNCVDMVMSNKLDPNEAILEKIHSADFDDALHLI